MQHVHALSAFSQCLQTVISADELELWGAGWTDQDIPPVFHFATPATTEDLRASKLS